MTGFQDKPTDKLDKDRRLVLPMAGGTCYGIHPERYEYWRVGYGTPEEFSLDFWLERVGQFTSKPNYMTGDFHWTHSTQIFYHLNGSAIFEYRNRTIEVQPGDIMIIPAGQSFYYRGSRIQYDWLAIAGDWPMVLGEKPDICYIDLAEDKDIREKFADIREVLIFQQYGYSIKAIGIFYELIARMAFLRHGSSDFQSSYPEVVRNAITYLTENYATPFNAIEMAASVNMSPSRLRSLFKEWLGKSPHQYHTHYRIKQASRLLREQHLSISQAAIEVGYDDVRYFSRVFKRVLGVSPRQFIKQY